MDAQQAKGYDKYVEILYQEQETLRVVFRRRQNHRTTSTSKSTLVDMPHAAIVIFKATMIPRPTVRCVSLSPLHANALQERGSRPRWTITQSPKPTLDPSTSHTTNIRDRRTGWIYGVAGGPNTEEGEEPHQPTTCRTRGARRTRVDVALYKSGTDMV